MNRNEATVVAGKVAEHSCAPAFVYLFGGAECESPYQVHPGPWVYVSESVRRAIVAVVLPDGRVCAMEPRAKILTRDEYVATVDGGWG
jgi:hypothetical protein